MMDQFNCPQNEPTLIKDYSHELFRIIVFAFNINYIKIVLASFIIPYIYIYIYIVNFGV